MIFIQRQESALKAVRIIVVLKKKVKLNYNQTYV